jgi:hypothetical protein
VWWLTVDVEAGKVVPSLPPEIRSERFTVEEVFLKMDKAGPTSYIRKRVGKGT